MSFCFKTRLLAVFLSFLGVVTAAHGSTALGASSVERFSAETGTTGDGWINDARSGADIPISFELVDQMAITEGDIVLGTEAQLTGRYPGLDPDKYAFAIAVSSIGSLWPDGILPYQVHTDLDSTSLPSKIAAAIDHIQSNTSVTFVERTSENELEYPDYVEFISAAGCASYIGRRGGKQNIWLSTACSTGNIIHELGHALGLYHEQAREDRNSYVAIHFENIASGKSHNFQQQLSNAEDSGDYDYGSIMHYGSYFFSRNGSPTITTINPVGVPIGQRIALSGGDIAALNKLYAIDLSLALQATPTLVDPGAMMTLSAHVTNIHGNGAREVTLTIPLPESSSLLGSDGDQWTCATFGKQVECERASLAGNASTSLEIYLSAPPVGAPLIITASLASTAFDNSASNNTDSTQVVINSQNFAPVINPNQMFNVYHRSPTGTSVGRVQGSDLNNDTLREFQIVSGSMMDSMTINPQTGELSVADNQMWDKEDKREFTLGVVASDGETLSSIGTVTIRLSSSAKATDNASDGGGGGLSVAGLVMLYLAATLLQFRNRWTSNLRQKRPHL